MPSVYIYIYIYTYIHTYISNTACFWFVANFLFSPLLQIHRYNNLGPSTSAYQRSFDQHKMNDSPLAPMVCQARAGWSSRTVENLRHSYIKDEKISMPRQHCHQSRLHRNDSEEKRRKAKKAHEGSRAQLARQHAEHAKKRHDGKDMHISGRRPP